MEYLNTIKKCQIFNGLSSDDMNHLDCYFNKNIREYKKGEYILNNGDTIKESGIMLEGEAFILRDDFWGNRNIISPIEKSDLFAEVFATLKKAPLNISVLAKTKCKILWVDLDALIYQWDIPLSIKNEVSKNLIMSLSMKNLYLTKKMNYISQRTTKDKLISFLSDESIKHNSHIFDIPYNRQQLADYLSVERSAMSKELCKLRDDGLLEFSKNHFVLKIK